jgi:UDP-glucose 4-epimerase
MSQDGVLLLGGGFIGMALANRLAADGRPVHVITRHPQPSNAGPVVVHVGDLGDPALLEKLSHQCATVVHLASATLPGSSARNPTRELDNLSPTLRLLETMQHWENAHLIFMSSGGTVYGNPAANPVSEHAPLIPLSNHGAGKVALEGFLHAFRVTGHPVTILRTSNAYGPGQSMRAGFGLVRTLLEHARSGESIEIWGGGNNVRDFVYIDDVVEVCKRFIEVPRDSDTYNLGSGIGYSVKQVLRVIEEVTGAELKTIFRPARRMDVQSVVLDISKLEARLEWRPQVELVEGVERTWAWLKSL